MNDMPEKLKSLCERLKGLKTEDEENGTRECVMARYQHIPAIPPMQPERGLVEATYTSRGRHYTEIYLIEHLGNNVYDWTRVISPRGA